MTEDYDEDEEVYVANYQVPPLAPCIEISDARVEMDYGTGPWDQATDPTGKKSTAAKIRLSFEMQAADQDDLPGQLDHAKVVEAIIGAIRSISGTNQVEVNRRRRN